MDYLSDEQIKILIISKESPTICDTIMQEDFDGKCLDQLIKSGSDFTYFSLCLTLLANEITQNKIQNIIKSKLGEYGLEELNSSLNILMDGAKNKQLVDDYIEEERNEANNESTDVFRFNTPEEDKDDWDYY